MNAPAVSVVIPFYGNPEPTLQLISQLRAQTGVDLEIIVSDDESPKPFPQTDGVVVTRRERNGGFGSAVNSAAALATKPYLLILNSDLEIAPSFVSDLVRAATPHMPCVAGCVLTSPAGHADYSARRFPKVQHSVVEWLTPLARVRETVAWHRAVGHDVQARPGRTKATDWVVGAVMLLRTADFRSVGGFDERFHMNSEEVDLQRRLSQHGVGAVYLGDVACLHEGGGSSVSELRRTWLMNGRFIYAEKWQGKQGARSLATALYAATAINFAFNTVRRIRNSEVKPVSTLNYELSLLRGRM